MYSSLFWKDFFERLVASLVQLAITLFTVDNITSFASIPLEAWAIAAVVMGLGVLAKSLGAAQKGNTVSPASFAPAAPDQPAVDAENAGRNEL